jgi:hypothetical protein
MLDDDPERDAMFPIVYLLGFLLVGLIFGGFVLWVTG